MNGLYAAVVLLLKRHECEDRCPNCYRPFGIQSQHWVGSDSHTKGGRVTHSLPRTRFLQRNKRCNVTLHG